MREKSLGGSSPSGMFFEGLFWMDTLDEARLWERVGDRILVEQFIGRYWRFAADGTRLERIGASKKKLYTRNGPTPLFVKQNESGSTTCIYLEHSFDPSARTDRVVLKGVKIKSTTPQVPEKIAWILK